MQLQANVTVEIAPEFIQVAEAIMRERNEPCRLVVMQILSAGSPILRNSIAMRRAFAEMLWNDLPVSTDDQT